MIAPSRFAATSGRMAAIVACGALLALGGSIGAADNDTRLVAAVRSGDSGKVRSLLRAGAPASAAEPDGTTALHWAVRADNVDMVNALLRAGARADAANRYGITPLALAAVNGNATTVGLLLTAGANPNAVSGEGETVLMAAARTGRPEPLKLLLDRGANVNAHEGHYGETALMWAAGHDLAEAVRLLVARGADVNARTKILEFPKVKVDLATMVTTALPRGGMTALMLAARQGAIEGAMALANAGADLNLQDPDEMTAVLFAIVNSHFELAAKLVEKGANPNIGDAAGMAALYAAVDMIQPSPLINRPPAKPTGNLSAADLVRFLLDHGADPNGRLESPLLMRQHNTGDATFGNGATPLMRAAALGDLALMRLMMDKGANPSLAMANQTTTMMVIMNGRGARSLAPESPAYQAIVLCLDRGADVNAVNANGETLLHQGVARGEAFVKLLLDHGARVDLKDKTGRTPLDIAMGVAPAVAPGRAGGGRGGRGAGPPGPPARASEATIALLRERMPQQQ